MHRSHERLLVSWWRSYIGSFIDMAQGIVGVVTFGLVRVDWDMRFVFYCANKDMRKRIIKGAAWVEPVEGGGE